MSIFGRALSMRRKRPQDPPQLPMDDIALETPAPVVTTRQGQFGAGQQPRDWWGAVGSVIGDVGAGLGGRQLGHVDNFLAGEQAAQDAADWSAELDGMDLAPEVRTFAEQNPDAFRKAQYEEAQAKKVKDEQLGLLSGLNLSPDVMALAQLNPSGFMEEAGKGAGKTQTDTHWSPITGWNRKPIMGQNGDSLFEWDGVSDPSFVQRPPSFDETEEARRNRAEESLTSRELDIRSRNARTAELNASRPEGGPSRTRGAIIDETKPPIPGNDIRYTPRQDGGADVEGFSGGRLIRVGVGADGRYAPTEGDPEIPKGKRFPPPSFSTIQGLGDKAGPTINLEEKRMQAIDAERTAAVNIKNIVDKYITQSEGYPFGSMWWDTALQAVDPRTRGLEGLNAQMALEIGKMAKGAMSDADREWFIKAAPNQGGKPESNATFAMRANAIANNANQYSAFMKAYRAEYGLGSVAEAQRYWEMYSIANPMFDDNGDAVEDRMTYTEFFTGQPAKRDDIFKRNYPGVRAPSSKLSDEQRREYEELLQMEREGLL